jgi:hypothetical protein
MPPPVITRTDIVNDDGSDTLGTAIDNTWKHELYDQIDDVIEDAYDEVAALPPTAHASSHHSGGSDAIKLDDLATPDDNTDLNVSTSRHGLTPKIIGSDGDVLTKSGTASVWAAPPGGASGFTEQTTTATGAQNNFSLNAHRTYLRCTGAAPSFSGFTVSGLAPSTGAQVLIECLGTTAKVTNQDTNSTAANRIITPSTSGQIVGASGLMLLIYDDTTDRWREHLLDPGLAISVAHSAGDYTGSGSLTWGVDAGDLSVYTYKQHGTSLELSITVVTSTPGGTTSSGLRAALPGFTGATGARYAIGYGFNNSANLAIYTACNGTTYIEFRRLDGANWTLETNATYVGFQGVVPIT